MNRVKTLGVILLTVLLIPLSTVFAQEEQQTVDDPTLYYQQVVDDITDQYEQQYADDISTTSDDISVGEEAWESILGGTALLFTGAYLIVSILLAVASYIFYGLSLSKIGKELGYKDTWFAWIPILNLIMLFKLGNQNPWLLLLFLIPGIGGLIILILTAVAIANISEKRGYEKILALLVLIPFGMFVLLYLLAWKPKK